MPTRYAAPKLLKAVMLFVNAPLVSCTASLSTPLATLNTLWAVSLPSFCAKSLIESNLAIDPILSSSSGRRERTALPTFPPMLRHFLIDVSSMSFGINSGKTTACPSGFPYDAPSFATVLLIEIPALMVKPRASKTAVRTPRATTQPLRNASTSSSSSSSPSLPPTPLLPYSPIVCLVFDPNTTVSLFAASARPSISSSFQAGTAAL